MISELCVAIVGGAYKIMTTQLAHSEELKTANKHSYAESPFKDFVDWYYTADESALFFLLR